MNTVLIVLTVCVAVAYSCTTDADCADLNCPQGQDPFCQGNHCHCAHYQTCAADSDCHGHCNAGGTPTCDDNNHCHCN